MICLTLTVERQFVPDSMEMLPRVGSVSETADLLSFSVTAVSRVYRDILGEKKPRSGSLVAEIPCL